MLELSRLALALEKLSQDPLPPGPAIHGVQGRLARPANTGMVGRLRMRNKLEGPRAYAPRVNRPA